MGKQNRVLIFGDNRIWGEIHKPKRRAPYHLETGI
jgi:hypothetical protein